MVLVKRGALSKLRYDHSRTQPALLRREIAHVFLNIFGEVGSRSFGR